MRGSQLIITGAEWKALTDIISRLLAEDDVFRRLGKTLFYNRKQVEFAQEELEKAAKRAKDWVLYIQREGCSHPIMIKTRRPERHKDSIAKNEKLLLCAPEHVRLEATSDVLFGIANACCKAIGLHEAMEKALLSNLGIELTRSLWRRCHLHWRRSVGARKASWRRKGYIAEYKEVPDFRDAEYHEGAKFLYDLKEAEYEG